jgi:DNA-binding NarL/FixJ family response regulator
MTTRTRKTRVLLADDHRLMLEGIRALLERDFDVVGTATNGSDLLELATQLQPDVIVLDIGISVHDGTANGRHLRDLLPSTHLLYLTRKQDAVPARQVFARGASGYLLKSTGAVDLIRAIREVAAGRTCCMHSIDPSMEASRIKHSRHVTTGRITSRQREVIQLLAQGGSMKEVASMLKITARTVAYHKYTVMHQHRLRSNAELIQFAIKQRMVAV